MDMKGNLGKLIGLPLAVAVLVGQSFVGYFTENGQVPPWMPAKLAGLAGWLATEISLPLWTFVLIVVCIGCVGALFVRLQSRTAREQQTRLAQMDRALADRDRHNAALEKVNLDLKQQIVAKTKTEKADSSALTQSDFNILSTFADLENRGKPATMNSFLQSSNLERLEINAALDTLVERGFVKKRLAYSEWLYHLVPAGRAYYLKHKDN